MSIPKIRPLTRPAKGHNKFCGPAALSIITGLDTAKAATIIRHVGNRRAVTGTSFHEMLRSLSMLGYHARAAAKVDPFRPKTNPTLAAWLKSPERDGKQLYLIAAGNHWQVVQGRRFCCGKTGEIVSIRDERVKRRARITGVWSITRTTKVDPASLVPLQLKARGEKLALTQKAARARARALAREHDIEIEIERYDGGSYIKVWGPECPAGADEEEFDPFYGDHEADDWCDALRRVEAYVAALEHWK